MPDGVFFPENSEEIRTVVKMAAEYRVPIIPFGTGTSLEGQVNAPYGGICVDTVKMNRILSVHAEDLDCTVEPGL
ncbi:MAG TPA: FAD-binding protein, partial [Rhizomicrobium sp.]|nr:FAD-binding protein [Rhizomicrobium sp.]